METVVEYPVSPKGITGTGTKDDPFIYPYAGILSNSEINNIRKYMDACISINKDLETAKLVDK